MLWARSDLNASHVFIFLALEGKICSCNPGTTNKAVILAQPDAVHDTNESADLPLLLLRKKR